ncbi:MAG: S8 family serine peptidase [Janthinobacterium lividum]
MSTRPRLLIAKDRHWTGAPVDLAALGQALEQAGTVSVVKAGTDRLVVTLGDEVSPDSVIAGLPPGTIGESVQIFDPQSVPTPPDSDEAAELQGSNLMKRDSRPPSGPTLEANTEAHTVGVTRYLIGPRRGLRARAQGLVPMSASEFDKALTTLEPHEHVRTVHPRASRSPVAERHSDARHHVLAHLSADRIAHLRRTLPPHVIVEPQIRFERRPAGPGTTLLPPVPDQAAPGEAPATTYRFTVLGEDEQRLPGVPLNLFCAAGATVNATTDAEGNATATVPQAPDTPLHGLYAKPLNSYWDLYVGSPFLSADKVNTIRVKSLAETHAGFPSGFRSGWGQRAMLADLLPEDADGRGVRVAIIDSGADNRHPSLVHIQAGLDCTGATDAEGWTRDTIGHGTHVAGLIAARPADKAVFRGFAPGAEVHALKVFPSGASDVLLDALDQCLHLDIDVVNMSLGSDQSSELIEQKLEELFAAGIACFVAAGNSGQRVQFPARSPFVLAVGAVGQVGTLMAGSWDETQVQQGLTAPDGVFSPRFSCFGPEVGVCAPGVGIVSTLPGGTFGPDTGTSMAAPHVTGLAALLLAHHPALGPQAFPKGPARVAALFDLVKRIASPYPFGAERTGAGLPTFAPLIQPQPGRA